MTQMAWLRHRPFHSKWAPQPLPLLQPNGSTFFFEESILKGSDLEYRPVARFSSPWLYLQQGDTEHCKHFPSGYPSGQLSGLPPQWGQWAQNKSINHSFCPKQDSIVLYISFPVCLHKHRCNVYSPQLYTSLYMHLQRNSMQQGYFFLFLTSSDFKGIVNWIACLAVHKVTGFCNGVAFDP